MEPIPSRLLKPLADACPTCPPLTQKDEARRAHILASARKMFIEHGFRRVAL